MHSHDSGYVYHVLFYFMLIYFLSTAEEEEDEQELTYADVKIVQRQDRQRQQRPNTEVEYGQVKFSERPQQTAEPTGDDCVYAKVHARS